MTSVECNWIHTSEIPVRWGDMDAMGHVNNTVYFRYMEQVRVDAFEAVPFHVDQENGGPIIVQTSCTFKMPLKHPDTVLVRLGISRIGRSSVETSYQICSMSKNGAVVAEGAATVVWIDMASERPMPVPESIRQYFEHRR